MNQSPSCVTVCCRIIFRPCSCQMSWAQKQSGIQRERERERESKVNISPLRRC